MTLETANPVTQSFYIGTDISWSFLREGGAGGTGARPKGWFPST
jgi:hypothetical protein